MIKVGIILTSIERDKSLFKAIQSILDNLQEDWMIILGYQSKTKTLEFSHPQVYSYELPYNCGISTARNDLIVKAYALGCTHVILTADSILFNESMKQIGYLVSKLNENNYDLVGLDLENRIKWEANLQLIPNESFQLDFIDSKEKEKDVLVPCDIVRNFWLARIEALVKVPYDEQLIMVEHEDWFYRFKLAGYKVCCTSYCSGRYNKDENTPIYDEIRSQNFRIGKQRLLKKYNLKSWVVYKNLERIQK
jgi:GT2 family glycosyltransferase